MIKLVLQSIPTYFTGLFLLPSSLEDEIESLIMACGGVVARRLGMGFGGCLRTSFVLTRIAVVWVSGIFRV